MKKTLGTEPVFQNNLTLIQPRMLPVKRYQVHIKARVCNISNESEVMLSNQKPEEKKEWRIASTISSGSYNGAEEGEPRVDWQ